MHPRLGGGVVMRRRLARRDALEVEGPKPDVRCVPGVVLVVTMLVLVLVLVLVLGWGVAALAAAAVACVRVCVRACVRACARACMRAFLCPVLFLLSSCCSLTNPCDHQFLTQSPYLSSPPRPAPPTCMSSRPAPTNLPSY